MTRCPRCAGNITFLATGERRCVQCGRYFTAELKEVPAAPTPPRKRTVKMLVNGTLPLERKPSARLTEQQVRDMLWKKQHGASLKELASEYGYSESAISRLWHRRTLGERFDRAVAQVVEGGA